MEASHPYTASMTAARGQGIAILVVGVALVILPIAGSQQSAGARREAERDVLWPTSSEVAISRASSTISWSRFRRIGVNTVRFCQQG